MSEPEKSLSQAPSTQSSIGQDERQDGVTPTADVAARFLASLDPSVTRQPVTPKDASKVRLKIDLIILPLIACTMILGATDKILISNAAILGMRDDLGLVGDQFSWAGSVFSFGYLAAEWPTALLIQRLPVAKFWAAMTCCWGALLLCHAATRSFAGLAAVRFAMGLTETCLWPVAAILTVMWYTNREQPVRVAIWYNQVSSAVSGILAYGMAQTHTQLAQWRLLYLVAGALTVLWSLVMLLALPDSPTTAWFLSDRERYIAVKRVQGNNTGVEGKRFKWYQARECLADPKTWLLALFACAQNVVSGAIVTFSAIIVQGLGYSVSQTTLLNMPTGIIATAWQIALAVPCALLTNKRCAVIALANLVPMTCAILLWKLPRSDRAGLLASYMLIYTYWGQYVLATSVPMANVSGHTKKVTLNAVYFFSYCVGQIIGPQVFRPGDAPDDAQGYVGLLACFVVGIAAISLYGLMCWWENTRRDREQQQQQQQHRSQHQEGQQGEVKDEFSDMTDKEKPGFRYMY